MSHRLAIALREWIPLILESVVTYESSEDIGPGTRWNDSLNVHLHEASYGIVCVTPYNTHSQWLHFEAGALSNAIGGGRVAPLLFRLTEADVVGPLSQFQSVRCNEAGMRHLVKSINESLPHELVLDPGRMQTEFKMWWPVLEPKLKEIPDDTEWSGDLPPLFLERQLFAIQGSPSCKAVWVITPDPYDHALDHSLWDGLAQNIERGVLYTFLVPQSKRNDAALLRLVDLGKRSGHEVTVTGIQDETFTQLAATDYVVINPGDSVPNVFVEIPAEQKGFWVEVKGATAQAFMRRFERMGEGPTLVSAHDTTRAGTSAASESSPVATE